MVSSRVIASSTVVLLAFLTITEGMSLRSLGAEQRCRCILTEDKTSIISHIQKVELIPASSHCEETEIIATLKTGEEVCLDSQALWVKKVIQKILANKKR
ncbi:interleukin-8 [Thalassophryne amazonica]|uniref:interleukin-8 n=1 Tax=Thalassophryne amazonica TaxID=390379 RepID=UPI001470D2A0|nr:interleukin-8 [Thalassophryne amazonica]